MLFRPKFCANCGEKIERADWGVFTSRRFCQVCESEFKGQDLIPRAIIVGGLLIGLFGLGSYLKSGSATSSLAVRQPTKLAEQKPLESPTAQPQQLKADTTLSQTPVTLPQTPTAQPASNQASKPTAVDESQYYCGAETRKGTPCTRRVKGNIRCYQHKGMPAMLPAAKLRIG